MVIDKLDITFDQDYNEVDDGEGKKKQVAVEGTGTTEHIHVKRLKWRRRTAIFAGIKTPTGMVDFDAAPAESQQQFIIDMICESVCTVDGKSFITADDLDDLDVWTDKRRNAYFVALLKHQSPKVEDAAKNSSSTSSATT